MIPNYSFNHLHIFDFFLIILPVYCFNEPCTDDSSCSKQGFQCRFNHCLCPLNSFWAGYDKHCLPCPNKWINLFVFCIYYDNDILNWIDADNQCRQMTNLIGERTRLLELNYLNEFEFIQNIIPIILTHNQMTIEINNSNKILSSAIAFVGSNGQRTSKEEWLYFWGGNVDKRYTSTSEMWCKQKHWDSTIIAAEPAWEQIEMVTVTFQALKRWNDSNNSCLISLPQNSKHPFLCEIIGEAGRLRNQSNLSFLFTTITNTLSSTTKQTVTTSHSSSLSTTRKQNVTIDHSLLSATISTNVNISAKLNSTNDQSETKPNHSLISILGILGILVIITLLTVIIYIQCKKKQTSTDLKSDPEQLLSRSKRDKKYADDSQSNTSSESHLSIISTGQESQRIFTDTQSLTPSKTTSVQASKLALWDEMESSLFPSTLPVPVKRQTSSSYQNNKSL